MELRRVITKMGLAAGLALAAFSGGGVNEARADEEDCIESCTYEDCASTKSCRSPGPSRTCGDWLSNEAGAECGPVVNSASYGNNAGCWNSPNRNSSSPLREQADAINALPREWESDWITVTYKIPWPSPEQDPCFGAAKDMVIAYTCGRRTTDITVRAEAANKTVVISCPH
jgi:hypothetical protein